MKKNNDEQIKIKEFDAVKFMRQQRERILLDISSLNNSEISEYFKKNTPTKRVKPSA